MIRALDVAAILITGPMIGVEFAISAFVHPAITKLEGSTHLAAAREIAGPTGRMMPFWYGLGLLALLVELWSHRSEGLPANLLIGASVLWAATIVFTLAALVPRNNRIATADPKRPYAGWQQDRRSWDALHRLRVAALGVAFVLLLIAVRPPA